MHIELRHLHKRFGTVHANNDITLTFESGCIYGILGENGAGKSTLMKILSGYQSADSGEIVLDGQRVDYHGTQAAIRAGIGMLQQDPLDVPAFTVLENFMYGGLHTSRRKARDVLAQHTGRFGFTLDPDAYVAELSIAQRQQLEIVRLLAMGVRLLILDEPTTGISAEQKALLFTTLAELAHHDNITVLLVSHKLEDVIALCDEVAVLRAGRITGTRKMPATSTELVQMMFGVQVDVYTREQAYFDNAPEVVSLENVKLRGGRVMVDAFNLHLRAGEIVGLAGLEGSGQELVLRACAGLVKPVTGRVVVHGHEMTGRPYRDYMRQGIAFAAAGRLEEGLVAGLTLTEHLVLAGDHGIVVDWKAARRSTEDQIVHYGVRGTADSRIETLSGGNQQRVLMAMMPKHPVAMILEQPTRGLDVDSARWIWEQLLERRNGGSALLFSSAELDEILAYSDRLIVLYAGRATELKNSSDLTVKTLGALIGGKTL
jgi:general nucleoside transport system ATP-binding protein